MQLQQQQQTNVNSNSNYCDYNNKRMLSNVNNTACSYSASKTPSDFNLKSDVNKVSSARCNTHLRRGASRVDNGRDTKPASKRAYHHSFAHKNHSSVNTHSANRRAAHVASAALTNNADQENNNILIVVKNVKRGPNQKQPVQPQRKYMLVNGNKATPRTPKQTNKKRRAGQKASSNSDKGMSVYTGVPKINALPQEPQQTSASGMSIYTGAPKIKALELQEPQLPCATSIAVPPVTPISQMSFGTTAPEPVIVAVAPVQQVISATVHVAAQPIVASTTDSSKYSFVEDEAELESLFKDMMKE